MEQHHPIMSKLWNLGDQTKRKKKKKTLPTISGDPDHESLNEMIQVLYDNSVTLTTTLDVGKIITLA